jgi:hypothetical protein
VQNVLSLESENFILIKLSMIASGSVTVIELFKSFFFLLHGDNTLIITRLKGENKCKT